MLHSISDLLKSAPCCSVDLQGNSKAPHLRGKINVYPWSTGVVLKAEIVNIPQAVRQIDLCSSSGFSAALNVYNGYCYTVFFAGNLKNYRFKLRYNGSNVTE